MKRAILLFSALLFISFPLSAAEIIYGFQSNTIPACEIKTGTIEGTNASGKKWKEYFVSVCDLPIFPETENDKLLRGVLWVNNKTNWSILYYSKNPPAKIYIEGLDTPIENRESRIWATDADLPLIIKLIRPEIREQYILGFLAYDNDSFEIFFLDNKKEDAELVASELNKILEQNRNRP